MDPAREQRGMGNAAHVPELQEDGPTARMHAVNNRFPPINLFGRMDSRRVEVALTHRRDLSGFGDDEPRRGALTVIRGRKRSRHTIGLRPISG